MFKRLCVALGLLTGCSSPAKKVYTEAGTSLPLVYPVLLIGQNTVDVRDDMKTLVSTSLSSSLNFVERKLVDSSGAIFEVKSATPVGAGKPWWSDMGTSQRSHFLELEKSRSYGFAEVKRLLLEQVESERSVWRGDAKAVARVRGFTNVAEVIDASRRSWEWAQ